MINVTTSTDGIRKLIGERETECHKAEDIEYVRHYGERTAQTVRLVLTREQAIDLMDDLRSQIDYTDRAQDTVARAMFTPPCG